ncbi:hypothetical protein BDL97_08G143400 [Sphagnum fallax]|nr:hypothetical protein BDL97_08G143400 [Sphagnum fallax]
MRVARATTLLRKSGMMMAFDFEQVSTPQRESNVLSRDRILELHNNCIKLAAENFNPMHAKKNGETKEVVAYQFGKGLKKSVYECLKVFQKFSKCAVQFD